MFTSKKRLIAVILSIAVLLTTGFMVFTASASDENQVKNDYTGKTPKYVFLFIGDGMSYPQINSAEIFLGKKLYGDKQIGISKLTFSRFPVEGTCTTFDAETFIPDSASTATSISTGNKTLGGIINMDTERKTSFKTISEYVKEKGYKVGVITSVSLDHATPAAFYAHQPSRNNYYDISVELAKSNFDFFGGGGFKQPKGAKGDQADVIEIAKQNGFKYVNTKEDILSLNSGSGKVIAVNPVLDRDNALAYEIDRTSDDLSLSDFVKKGIDVLDNPQGFFMMVEGGKIDWACHANDAATSIKDTLAFSKSVDQALQFYEKHPDDTLIIVTGDHETGGMTIGFAGTAYETFFDKIGYQKKSFLEFDKEISEYRESTPASEASLKDLLPSIKESFGLMTSEDADAPENEGMVLSDYELETLKAAFEQTMIPSKERNLSERESILYGTYEPLSVTITHILNNKSGIGWTTYSHTGLPLPVFAKGLGQEIFDGYYDNTDLFKKMAAILKIELE